MGAQRGDLSLHRFTSINIDILTKPFKDLFITPCREFIIHYLVENHKHINDMYTFGGLKCGVLSNLTLSFDPKISSQKLLLAKKHLKQSVCKIYMNHLQQNSLDTPTQNENFTQYLKVYILMIN